MSLQLPYVQNNFIVIATSLCKMFLSLQLPSTQKTFIVIATSLFLSLQPHYKICCRCNFTIIFVIATSLFALFGMATSLLINFSLQLHLSVRCTKTFCNNSFSCNCNASQCVVLGFLSAKGQYQKTFFIRRSHHKRFFDLFTCPCSQEDGMSSISLAKTSICSSVCSEPHQFEDVIALVLKHICRIRHLLQQPLEPRLIHQLGIALSNGCPNLAQDNHESVVKLQENFVRVRILRFATLLLASVLVILQLQRTLPLGCSFCSCTPRPRGTPQ